MYERKNVKRQTRRMCLYENIKLNIITIFRVFRFTFPPIHRHHSVLNISSLLSSNIVFGISSYSFGDKKSVEKII